MGRHPVYFNSRELDLLEDQTQLRSFWDQLAKDTSGYSNDFKSYRSVSANGFCLNEEFTAEDLIDQLSRDLKDYCTSDSEAFFNAMYRIDVPEHMMNELVLRENSSWKEFSLLLGKRILLKLALRNKYKS